MKKDLEGKYFGQLKVIKYIGNSKYLCECKCGNLTEVRTCNLTNGHTQSCGCLAKKTSANNGRKSLIDLSGKQFGKLKVIKYIPETKNGNVIANVIILVMCHKITWYEKMVLNLVAVLSILIRLTKQI